MIWPVFSALHHSVPFAVTVPHALWTTVCAEIVSIPPDTSSQPSPLLTESEAPCLVGAGNREELWLVSLANQCSLQTGLAELTLNKKYTSIAEAKETAGSLLAHISCD